MSYRDLDAPSCDFTPHNFLASSDQLPTTFGGMSTNRHYHSYYDNAPSGSRRPAVMACHGMLNSSTAPSAHFEPVSDFPLDESFDVYRVPSSLSHNSHHSAPRHNNTTHNKTTMHPLLPHQAPQRLAEARIPRLFSRHPNAEPVSVQGHAFTLQKLLAAVQTGLAIAPFDSISMAAAFENSLLPFQAASILPTQAQMLSLFSLPTSLQQASGLDLATDFSIFREESVRYISLVKSPSLRAYMEIDCARQYLEICSRHQDIGTVVEIGIVTLFNNCCSLDLLPIISGKRATLTLFMFRHFESTSGREMYRPFFTRDRLFALPAEPLPRHSKAVLLNERKKGIVQSAVRVGCTDHGETTNKMILNGKLDILHPPYISAIDRPEGNLDRPHDGMDGIASEGDDDGVAVDNSVGAVRRSARVRRSPVSHIAAEIEQFADDEGSLHQQDSTTEGEDSDISEYGED